MRWLQDCNAGCLTPKDGGYKKEHIKVQLVHSRRLLVVRGECPVAGNRWSRFRLELPVPGGCDAKAIHARFDNGVLRVTIPPGMINEPEMPAAKTTGADAVAGQAPTTDDTVKEGGRESPGSVGDQQQVACGGYRLLREQKKLATTLLGVVLVLFSFVIYIRYSD
uniref:SHSP domain-containing protein n=1 Tax=Leersia perrieri TaxID=77586 RepID=A0A0D9XK01_9ORYZ